MRPSPRIFRWGGGVRLSATGGPPAGSVFGEFAHFGAPGGSLGKVATAIATGYVGACARGRVCPYGVCGDAGEKHDFQGEPQCPAAETVAAGGAHGKSLEGKEEKTSSAGVTKRGETGVMVRN